jgi:uncharacterized protein (TIGR02118 family)
MTFCWFARTDATGVTVTQAELSWLAATIAPVPGVTWALLFTPSTTHDPYLNDGEPPALALQIYFDRIEALEAALAAGGGLMALADPAVLPSLAGATFTQQAMLVRSFAVPDPVFRTAPGAEHCTYLVAYEGTAEDLPAWLSHYISHHTAIMTRFPGIRQVEVCSRIDWCGALPWPRVDYMQRNKVVFDDADALTAALNSPVRHEMRADFANFPPFTGMVSHFPMATRVVRAG